MTNEDLGIIKFFKKIWYQVEPFVKELIVYSIVIFTFSIVSYFTKPYLDDKLKDAIDVIKWIVVIGSLGLFAFHTLSSIVIGVTVEIVEEVKEGYYKITEKRKTKDGLLNPRPAINDIEDFKRPRLNRTGEEHD